MALFQYGDKFTVAIANLIRKLWAAASPPASPAEGEIYLDISASPYQLKRYSGSEWEAIGDSGGAVPVKATGAEINAGIDDAKFATAKAIADSDIAFISDIPSVPVKATGTELNTGTDDAKFATAKALADSDYAKLSDIPIVTGAGTLNEYRYIGSLADDAVYTLPFDITNAAFGFAALINEYCWFHINAAGNVHLTGQSSNTVANADTDGKLCIGTANSQEPLQIKNRRASAGTLFLIIFYD
jgi:hypothetical protein